MFYGEGIMKKITLLLFALIFPAAHAQAQNGLGLGLSVGSAGQEYSDIYTDFAGLSEVSGRDSSTGFRISIPLAPLVLMEGAFYDYGQGNDDYIDNFGDIISVKLSTTSINLGMAGIIPLSYTPTDLIGRIGLALWDSEVEFRDSSMPGTVLKDKDDGVGIYVGFGIRTALTRNVKLGFEYTFLGFDTQYTNVSGEQYIDNFALTLDVGF
jgi:opacity protein-like surface antigen